MLKIVIYYSFLRIRTKVDFSKKTIEYIAPDELVEITPTSVRLRKKILNIHERRKASRKEEAAVED